MVLERSDLLEASLAGFTLKQCGTCRRSLTQQLAYLQNHSGDRPTGALGTVDTGRVTRLGWTSLLCYTQSGECIRDAVMGKLLLTISSLALSLNPR